MNLVKVISKFLYIGLLLMVDDNEFSKEQKIFLQYMASVDS